MKNGTLVVIVTYNPDINLLLGNVRKLMGLTTSIYISDNGSDNAIQLVESLSRSEFNSVILKTSDSNNGLASAQNKGMAYAIDHNYKFVCNFDQDTVVPPDFVSNMESEFEKYQDLYPNDRIGMLAPNFYDFRLEEYTHFARLTDHSYQDVSADDDEFKSVSFAVSSGSFFPVSVVAKLGLFIPEYFIDQIDTEYCLRLAKYHYSIIVTPRVVLKHTIGNREKKHLFGLTIKPNYHSRKRKYFIFRNGMRTWIDYGSLFPGFRVLMFKRFVHDFLGVLFYENDKVMKIRAMLSGLIDGRKNVNEWSNEKY